MKNKLCKSTEWINCVYMSTWKRNNQYKPNGDKDRNGKNGCTARKISVNCDTITYAHKSSC